MEFENYFLDKVLSEEIIGFIRQLQGDFKIKHLHIEITLTDETTVQIKF